MDPLSSSSLSCPLRAHLHRCTHRALIFMSCLSRVHLHCRTYRVLIFMSRPSRAHLHVAPIAHTSSWCPSSLSHPLHAHLHDAPVACSSSLSRPSRAHLHCHVHRTLLIFAADAHISSSLQLQFNSSFTHDSSDVFDAGNHPSC